MKKKLVALGLCVCMATPLIGCGGDSSKVETKANTINIKMVETGWGTTWIEDAEEKFEELYKEEGYKVNILPESVSFKGTSALNEIRAGYDDAKFDIVISSGYTVQQVTDDDYKVQVEPLTDVMTSQPINFDGSLGADTIENLYNDSQAWRLKIGDTYWGVPYTSEVRGLVCNMKALNEYGITEMPVTTDELFEDFDIVYNGVEGKKGIRPVVWGGYNAYGYALPSFYNTIAQLMGLEEYEKFFSLDYLLTDDGKIKADGYDHVNNDSVKEAIKVTMHEFDVAYSMQGSLTQDHGRAHAAIASGKAAFMFDGNFFYNEIRKAFPSYVNDVRFTLLPITSKLGVDLKLDGTGTDREKCDDILSFMAKKVDEGKSVTEIKSLTETEFSISLTDEKVNRVIEARTTGNGGDSFLNIMKGSPNVEIAKLFVRMLLSEDAANEIYAKYGMISPTYSEIEVNHDCQFVIDSYKAKNACAHFTTSQLYPNSVRAKTNLFLLPSYDAKMVVTFKDEIGTTSNPANRNYDMLTETIFNKVVSTTKKNWKEYMSIGGYSLEG